MRILHLTDFHYSSEQKYNHDQNKIVEALIADVLDSDKIDFVFFTGDLVFSGKRIEDFNEAKRLLLDKLVEKLKIDKNKIFICGGNHDVFRNQELEDTAEKIKEIKNSVDLESFLKRQEGKSFTESLKNIANYYSFENSFYKEYRDANDIYETHELYTIHKTLFQGKRIGILTINSAWRAIDSDFDRGNLLFPMSILKTATARVKTDTDFRILLMHHPITDFKDWNASEMEDLIHNEFHLLFSGHLHKKKQTIHICIDEGIFCCSSPATLAFDSSINGYTLITVDVDTYDIEIENTQYNKEDAVFLHPKQPIKTAIPLGENKREANSFKKTLRKKHVEELERANELFISYDNNDNTKGFNEIFTDPILKHKTQAQIAENRSDVASTSIGQIMATTENFVIFGKDKSGKTSVLYKLFLDLLVDFTAYKTIPVYIDAKEFKNSKKQLDLYKIIGAYFEMNQAKTKELPSKYCIRLLIDNYDPGFDAFNQIVNEFLETNKAVSFIATTEEKLATGFATYEFDGRTYVNLYIHEISRPEIRLLANKWPNLTTDKKEIILDKIFGIFNQLNIPTNYWTVSLFLWIFEKNNDANFHNSFELIQLYIDNLLDRKGLALDKSSKLKFDDLKSYLGALAHFLMIDRIDKGYTATYAEIVNFTAEYRDKNKRFVINVEDIIVLIIEKNILRKSFDDSYTFRLNGVFEYFIALHMTNDKKFANDIIADDHFYLSFKNELELYAGFEKNNEDFLNNIFERTKGIFNKLTEQYSTTNIDAQLMLKVSDIFDISLPMQKIGSFQKALAIEKQDEMLVEMNPLDIQKSEVKAKQYYEIIEDNADNLEVALHILSRVFRNSNIQDDKQVNDILDFILNSSCYLGFKLMEEAEAEDFGIKTENLSEDQEKMIVQLLTNFMPLIVQTYLYDGIGQNDLERIFKDKIKELSKDKKNNQFKLLILYFTLIDLDVNANKKLIQDVINSIDLNILRQTTIIKLYYYLMFKCNNRPLLENFIKEQIRIQTLLINPKTDIGELQKGVGKTAKIAKLRDRSQKRK